MNNPLVYILNEQKSDVVMHVDGISGQVYVFRWNKSLPNFGGCYTYEPKDQAEIDDIMQSQFHGIFYYSIIVPGSFVEEEAPKEEPASTAKEPEPPTPPEPANFKAFFEKIPSDKLTAEVTQFEGKEDLTSIITVHGGEAPAKQSGVPKFQAVAIESILNSRKTAETPDEEETVDI